ncbi:MAG: NAD(P)H-hydrate dehydratase, partial [Gracilibacteraceae bacterium]|nr:NAD(P)H-hydrate dehydratase [Gracilibacteraceae bacterium]
VKEWGIPGMVLMENAARAVVNAITRLTGCPENPPASPPDDIAILVGKGNNGGDGLAVARHLQVMGFAPAVYFFADPQELAVDALSNYELYQKMDGTIYDARSEETYQQFGRDIWRCAVVVDALYGTGFAGELPEAVARYTQMLNSVQARKPAHTHTLSSPYKSACPKNPHRIPLSNCQFPNCPLPIVVAVDIASGLDAGTGQGAAATVRADVTVTFGLSKLGHYLEQGPEYTGRLIIDKISLPEHVIAALDIPTRLLTADAVRAYLPRRSRDGHKGTHGCGLIVGGSTGMSGALVLAGRGALRSGIGLVQIVTAARVAPLVDAGLTEATLWPTWPMDDGDTMDGRAWEVIAERLAHAQACAVGPGLKQPPQFLEVLGRILQEKDVPLILDADALNLLAARMDLLKGRQGLDPAKTNLIMTPHPGEMARLCRISVAEVQKSRLELAVAKAAEWNAVVVLKGANTIVASPLGQAAINTTGNSGLGTGGTGDVLTGSILAWLAQGVPPYEAAQLGVYLHGCSADHLAAGCGGFGYTAGEVADGLPACRERIGGQ